MYKLTKIKIDQLISTFIEASPKFYDDASANDIDKKHQSVISSAYQQFSNGVTGTSFRSWTEQSDLGTPVQLSIEAFMAHGVIRVISRYLYRKLFKFSEEGAAIRGIHDDIQIVANIDGKNLILENPVNHTPGVSDFYNTQGMCVNTRWLRYLYIFKRLVDSKIFENENVIWIDVGSFYGGLQGLVRKYFPHVKIVMVDFHHQLCRSYIYLSTLFPEANHILPNELAIYKDFSDLPSGSIFYLPAGEFHKFQNMNVHLATNFFSFGEMRRPVFLKYFDSNVFKNSEMQMLVNRVVSSPYFEKTYDTDLCINDYYENCRIIKYFDIFPMHHYHLIARKLFGVKALRNVSSPYFELITHKKKH